MRTATLAALALALAWSIGARAHCDTLDGPVVESARSALEAGNVNRVLGWVRSEDEAEVRAAFDKARTVRKAGGEAGELADRYFFETLVRVHRAGEGAGFNGLKPAGQVEPPVAAADRALATGKLEPLGRLVIGSLEKGLHQRFEAVMAKRRHDPNDVNAAREYVAAYVEFVHYAERLYDAAQAPGHDAGKPATGHEH